MRTQMSRYMPKKGGRNAFFWPLFDFGGYFLPQIYWFLIMVTSPNYFGKLAPEIFSTAPLRVESLKKKKSTMERERWTLLPKHFTILQISPSVRPVC